MDADAIFVDTNVLVYASQASRSGPSTPLHEAATRKLPMLEETDIPLWISRQILREYLGVVTRPQANSGPLPLDEAIADAKRFLQIFYIAEDGLHVTDQLLALLTRFPTSGRQVHDANIVATMMVSGIERLLTFNTGDFARFRPLITLEPV
jgi:predicted nucleic acid-binding protein